MKRRDAILVWWFLALQWTRPECTSCLKAVCVNSKNLGNTPNVKQKPCMYTLCVFFDLCPCVCMCVCIFLFQDIFPHIPAKNISLLQQKKPINCTVRTEFNCCPPYSPCLSAFLAALQLIWYNNAPQTRLRTFFRWQKIINDATCTAECQHQLDLFMKY